MRALSLLFAGLLLSVSSAAQAPSGGGELSAARERWATMDPAERSAVLERYRAFEEMGSEERAALRHRADHLRGVRSRVREHLPPPTRQELDRLPPPERTRLLGEHVHQELGAIGRGFREELPRDLRRELERARPERWSGILRERGRRDRGLGCALAHLAGELGVDPEERRAVEALPPDEREVVVLAWTRESLVRKIEARRAALGELPPGVDEATWQALLELPPDEFLTELRRLTGFGAFAPRRGGRPFDRAGPPGEGGFADPFSLDRASGRDLSALHELRQLLRPRLDEQLTLRELPPGNRSEELARRVRERVLAQLEESGLFAEELPALRALEGQAFLDRVSELVHQSSRSILFRGKRWRGHGEPGPRGSSRREWPRGAESDG